MTNVEQRALVRPVFLKVSLLVAILLLPVVSHAVWSYVEMRRLDGNIREVIAKDEPIVPEVYRRTYVPTEAERFYLAATALTSDSARARDFAYRPERFDWSPASVAALKSTLEKYQEALTFLDRAAELPFQGFRPGTHYGPGFGNVLSLAGARAAVRVAAGDGDGAVNSVAAAVRAGRTMRGVLSGTLRSAFFLNEIFDRTRPAAASVERLAAALAEADDDAELWRWFVEQRANVINTSHVAATNPEPVSWVDWIVRPWQAHELNWRLEIYARLIAAAREPWPQRLDHVIAVGELPYPVVTPTVTPAEMLEALLWTSAAPLAILRANRIVVAIERYKRDHDGQLPDAPQQLVPAYLATLPVDPFSGQPLIVQTTATGYAVYSVSMNRRDDGGVDLNRSSGFVFPKSYPPDLGVRVGGH